ncbi:MAG: bifunctional 3-demethylubiquinol 3-O-methyltransferase/2-polyprenyl-6-hydroxyphenol methylase [Methylophaga sp.]|nr:MAG: bifunctional 3-demethylubiquinol 3-O-methyltransferase/2-polyprenyl-6-hydroxyphenol methylase [Methylophaga sp.]
MTAHANVDPAEVAKFEALATSWWDTEGESKPLHDLNPVRLGYIQQCCQLADSHVIDVGCGGGILSESLAKNGANVTGIDMGKMPLDIAKLHALEANLIIDYQQITAEQKAQQAAEQFDIVTCMEMLEHVPDPASVIQACSDLVKPGGDIFFSTLNRHPKAYLLAVLGAEYIMKMLPKGTHDYQRFIRPSEMAAWCRQAGLEVQDITGMTYNPISKTFKLSEDVKVNYLMYCRKALD